MADKGQDGNDRAPPVWFMDQLDNLIQRHHASYQEWLSRRERAATASRHEDQRTDTFEPATPDFDS